MNFSGLLRKQLAFLKRWLYQPAERHNEYNW